MPYQWPLDPQELFVERYPQMVNTGLPAQDADAMRAAITDMWPDAPGGWVFEWSRLGEVPDHRRRREAQGAATSARALSARGTGLPRGFRPQVSERAISRLVY